MSEELQSTEGSLAGFVPGLPEIVARVMTWVDIGGPVVIILFAMSVMALTIVLAKLWQFGTVRLGDLGPAREALRLYQSGLTGEALILVSGRARNPAAGMLARAIRGRCRELPESMVREEVLRFGGDALESLRAGFRPLEVIASLAPLLGLFGTVLGMIEAFRQLELAGSQVDPAILSGGIWEALLTTAVGLAVAIPVVAVLGWMERRVERLAHQMSSITTRVFTVDLSEEAVKTDDAPARIHPAAALAGE